MLVAFPVYSGKSPKQEYQKELLTFEYQKMAKNVILQDVS